MDVDAKQRIMDCFIMQLNSRTSAYVNELCEIWQDLDCLQLGVRVRENLTELDSLIGRSTESEHVNLAKQMKTNLILARMKELKQNGGLAINIANNMSYLCLTNLSDGPKLEIGDAFACNITHYDNYGLQLATVEKHSVVGLSSKIGLESFIDLIAPHVWYKSLVAVLYQSTTLQQRYCQIYFGPKQVNIYCQSAGMFA